MIKMFYNIVSRNFYTFANKNLMLWVPGNL